MTNEQKMVKESFINLRNKLIESFEKIDRGKFKFKNWKHSRSGGGTIAIIKGKVIEKGGVNISTVGGQFSESMRSRIPGAREDPNYWATGISVVIHPKSPLVPSMHFNTCLLYTSPSPRDLSTSRMPSSA